MHIEIGSAYPDLRSLFGLVKSLNFDTFDLQHSLFNFRFYLFIHSLICIAIQTFVMIAFFDMITKFFIVSEYESKTIFDVLFSSSLNEKWFIQQEIFQKINKIVKFFEYAIVIDDFQKFFQKIKNKFILKCNKNRKSHNSKFTIIKFDAKFKRIQCFFKAIVKLDDDDKWIFTKIVNSKHNHFEKFENVLFKHRQYAMIDEIKKNIQFQLKNNSIFFEIFTFIQKKYNHDANNSMFEIKNISNYIAILRIQRLNNIIFIQILNVTLQNDFNWFVKMQLNSMTFEIEYFFFVTKFRKKCFCITMKFSFWIAFTKSIDITYFWSLKLKSRV